MASLSAYFHQRLQQKTIHDYKADPKPEVSFYHSSDSDADQVYAANKKLDRCASLLKNIMEDRHEVAGQKRAPALKSRLSQGTRSERKKVVKIVLPNANEIHNSGPPKSKAGRMVTSTPTMTGKIKYKKTKEDELKEHISTLEAEKSLLQDQYSQLMQQHLSTPGSNISPNQKLGALSTNYELNNPLFAGDSPAMTSGLPQPFTPSSATSSNMTSNQIFKALEKTIHGISEKLTFPSTFTPSRRDHENSYSENKSDRSRESEALCKQPSDPLSYVRQNSVEDRSSPYVKQDGTRAERVAWPSESLEYQEIENSIVPNSYLSDFSKANASSVASSSELDEQTNLTLTERVNLENDYIEDSVDRSEDQLYHSLWSYHSDHLGATGVDNITEDASLKEMHLYYGENNLESTKETNEGYDDISGQPAERISNRVHFIEERCQVTLDDEGQELNGTSQIGSNSVASGENISGDELDVNLEKESGGNVQQAKSSEYEKFAENENDRSFAEGEAKTDEIEMTNRRNILDVKGKKIEEGKKERKTLNKPQRIEDKTQKTEEKQQRIEDKTQKTKDKRQSQGYHVSPKEEENKRVMDVISQLAKIKFDDGKKARVKDPKVHLGGIQPRYAATQVTALSYLFKELMNLLGEKTNSEEHRLLSEIDHMIGLLPFMISNLNPDLQTEINLAVQPLRLESSDLRRQLRIANQKIRDFEVNVKDLQDSLAKAKKTSIDEIQLDNLRRQIIHDEEERNILKSKIADVSKMVESMKAENMRLLAKIAEKDAESVRYKQTWHKEKSSIYSENEVLKKKLESLSLALQAQEKENKILRLSISQSEGEIVRVKDLNRGLRESVSKLLQDVNFQDARQKDRNFNNIQGKKLLVDQIPVRDIVGQNAANTVALNNVGQPIYGINREKPGSNQHQPSRISLQQQSYANGPDKYGKGSGIQPGLYERANYDLFSDKESDLLSCSMISESTMSSSSYISKNGEFVYNTTQGQTFNDQYSSLFCDSGDFRLNMADLSANIKKMQQALQTAKRS
eukprot:Seg1048.15 transcript_id=Seg1048.15/GoldUCD/mRNA.D3Y31 product="Coiled-coil domain-containing protein 14" protein_id=Seg1048.15/GoldUCD/D3Y31